MDVGVGERGAVGGDEQRGVLEVGGAGIDQLDLDGPVAELGDGRADGRAGGGVRAGAAAGLGAMDLASMPGQPAKIGRAGAAELFAAAWRAATAASS